MMHRRILGLLLATSLIALCAADESSAPPAAAKAEPEKARIFLMEALKVDPNSAIAHNNLGVLEADLGHSDEAVTHFKKSLSATPDYLDASLNLGQTWFTS